MILYLQQYYKQNVKLNYKEMKIFMIEAGFVSNMAENFEIQ
jgi:hypothetical protein